MEFSGKIAFASGRSTDFDIWVLDLATGALTRCTSGNNLNDYPKWSPDGKKIAYISIGEDTIASLWVMDGDGTNKKRLTTKYYCQYPSWASDGKKILFTANAGNPNEIEVCSINADGSGEPEPVLKRAGRESEPSCSPDGKTVVFAAPESVTNGISSRNTDIWEYSLITKESRRLVTHPARDYSPCYSPDGKSIAFVSHRNENTDREYLKHLQDINNSIKLGDMPSINASIKKITALEQDSDIWVMDRDGRNLRALTNDRDIDVGIAWSPCSKYILHTAATRGNHETERLTLIEVSSGKKIPFTYDRTPLEAEIGASDFLNKTYAQRLIPDFIERRLVDFTFWGEERHPDWTE